MKIHEKYLSRSLQIASNAVGTASPNPAVGAVIVHEDRIIGEGFTSPFGGPHAEVRAIAAVKDRDLLRKATLYVTLEPCCHHGKTPPCTDLILEVGIPRIAVGMMDPHSKVAGRGIARLREAGCDVTVGVLEDACRRHHRRFVTFHEKQRPYVVLKWAQSSDGFMAPNPKLRDTPPRPYWITGSESRQHVHQWRSEEQAILVGTQTAIQDNPRLTTRQWKGKDPLRILIDRELKVPTDFHIFDKEVQTLVFCNEHLIPDDQKRVRYLGLTDGNPVVGEVLTALWEEQVLSVMVEGGAHTLNSFLESGSWDEARILEGPVTFGEGLKAPNVEGRKMMEYNLGSDQIRIIRNVAKSDI